MKTTLIISDKIMPQIKAMAAKKRQTLSQMVEELLRKGLQSQRPAKSKLPPLPEYEAGKCFVDISDRDQLYRVMEGR